jgi:hypothetical protein
VFVLEVMHSVGVGRSEDMGNHMWIAVGMF